MFLWIIIIIAAAGILALAVPRIYTQLSTLSRIYDEDTVPQGRVAIVFGAGLQRNGEPTAVLRDRVAAAVNLYFTGKVEKLLMSGDNRYLDYNEPGAMFDYAVSLGVPPEAIVLDYAGRRTYDTCYRASHIFGLQEAILVTQSFHLPRAVFTCRALGLNAIGVHADRRTYSTHALNYWRMRELPATLRAMLDVWLLKPLPVLGDPEPIFIETAARGRWRDNSNG